MFLTLKDFLKDLAKAGGTGALSLRLWALPTTCARLTSERAVCNKMANICITKNIVEIQPYMSHMVDFVISADV